MRSELLLGHARAEGRREDERYERLPAVDPVLDDLDDVQAIPALIAAWGAGLWASLQSEPDQ